MSPRERLGVTVGKFNPPHVGHAHLIEAAKSQCDRLVVIVADRPDQTVRATQRAAWLHETHSDVEFVCTPDDLPEAPEPWAERTITLVGRHPDVAFTSEDYGVPWAAAMDCMHVAVDPSRQAFDTSGTALRENLAKNFSLLVPAARRDLAVNVVVVGVESSGTTTLAEGLASALSSVVVPEYGREYWTQRVTARPDQPWNTADFLHIAREHHERGRKLALKSTGVTVWDTDALATGVWHRRYLGHRCEEIESIAEARQPDLYILTVADFPFVQDGTREEGAHRVEMEQWFREALDRSGVPWIEVGGSHKARLAEALAHVHALQLPQLR